MAKESPALKVHHLRPAPGAKTAKTRVGRGQGSKGKTAGRGTKGTKARYQVSQSFEGGQMPMHMRLPKLRGFKNPFRTEYQVVNLDRISMLFPEGGDVTVEDLVAKGAVRDGELVKVLGTGEITVKVGIQKCQPQPGQAGGLLGLANLFSGGALLQLSVFALGIMPYITASIIIQLLVVVIPRFETLKQEGQSGTAKLTQYTRYLTIGLAVLQSSTLV